MKNKNNYQELQRNAQLKLVGDSSGKQKPKLETMPIEEIERHYLRDTDTLIGLLDGSIVDSEHLQSAGNPEYEGATDEVIYLDKSARNIYLLVRDLWDEMSNGAPYPKANFLNIDKEEYLEYMGFGYNGENLQDINPETVDITRMDPEFFTEMTTRIRCLFLEKADFDTLDEENLAEAWNTPTHFDGKNIAIVDEVKSSGNTLSIALQLLRASFPEANFNGYYWSAPAILRWSIIDQTDGVSESTQFAASRVPVWYDADTASGRGVDDKNIIESGKSKFKFQRIGKFVLSTPYKDGVTGEVRKTLEPATRRIREDLSVLTQRFKDKQVGNFIPSLLRSDDEIKDKIEHYYGVTYDEWLKAVRNR